MGSTLSLSSGYLVVDVMRSIDYICDDGSAGSRVMDMGLGHQSKDSDVADQMRLSRNYCATLSNRRTIIQDC